jgi:hypothetical protein
MEKHEFIKLAPMYYALAIALKMSALDDDEYITTDVFINDYSETGFRDLLHTIPLLDRGIALVVEHKLVDIVYDRFAPALLKKGSKFDEQLLVLIADESSPFFRYSLARKGAREWLEIGLTSVNQRYEELQIQQQDFDSSNQEMETIPPKTPDHEWEPIPLDRSNEKLQAAIGALDETVEQVRSDNGYAATHPEERKYVLTTLQTAAKSLKEDTQISIMYLQNFVLEPLERLRKRFGPSLLGVGTKVALKAFQEWLKDMDIKALKALTKYFLGIDLDE